MKLNAYLKTTERTPLFWADDEEESDELSDMDEDVCRSPVHPSVNSTPVVASVPLRRSTRVKLGKWHLGCGQ